MAETDYLSTETPAGKRVSLAEIHSDTPKAQARQWPGQEPASNSFSNQALELPLADFLPSHYIAIQQADARPATYQVVSHPNYPRESTAIQALLNAENGTNIKWQNPQAIGLHALPSEQVNNLRLSLHKQGKEFRVAVLYTK